MRLYSLISIMQAQFGTLTSIKKVKTKLQTLQNKCVHFCLQLDNKAHVGITEFKQINWLPVNYRFRQCLAANVFKFFDDKYPLYMKDIFDKSCISQTSTRNYSETKSTNQGEPTMVNAVSLSWLQQFGTTCRMN